jgi:hypothetical protein
LKQGSSFHGPDSSRRLCARKQTGPRPMYVLHQDWYKMPV